MSTSNVWSKADIHIHSSHSDGLSSIPEIMEYVQNCTDLKVIAITDHPVSPLARAAHVTLEIGDDPAVEFRTLVAAVCAAQALVMQVGFGVTRPG